MSPKATSMGFLDKLRLLTEWAPLLGQVQIIMAAEEPSDKAQAIVDALQFAATKSETAIDDELLGHIEAILKSDEGQAAFAWAVEKIRREEAA